MLFFWLNVTKIRLTNNNDSDCLTIKRNDCNLQNLGLNKWKVHRVAKHIVVEVI